MRKIFHESLLPFLFTILLLPFIAKFVDNLLDQSLVRCIPLQLDTSTQQFCDLLTRALYPELITTNRIHILRILYYIIASTLIFIILVRFIKPFYIKYFSFLRIKKYDFLKYGFLAFIIYTVIFFPLLPFIPIPRPFKTILRMYWPLTPFGHDSLMDGNYPKAINPAKRLALIFDSYAQSEKWRRISENNIYNGEYFLDIKYQTDQPPNVVRNKIYKVLKEQNFNMNDRSRGWLAISEGIKERWWVLDGFVLEGARYKRTDGLISNPVGCVGACDNIIREWRRFREVEWISIEILDHNLNKMQTPPGTTLININFGYVP